MSQWPAAIWTVGPQTMIKPSELDSDRGRDVWDTITAAAVTIVPFCLLEILPSQMRAQ